MNNNDNLQYFNNGLTVTPETITLGDRIRLTYNGLLASNGAEEIYAHIGFGDTTWNNITDIKMNKKANGFEVVFPVTKTGKLNIAFRDSTDNWDNNNKMNYIFNVQNVPPEQ